MRLMLSVGLFWRHVQVKLVSVASQSCCRSISDSGNSPWCKPLPSRTQKKELLTRVRNSTVSACLACPKAKALPWLNEGLRQSSINCRGPYTVLQNLSLSFWVVLSGGTRCLLGLLPCREGECLFASRMSSILRVPWLVAG